MSKVLAIIPARGGSKGLPRKNLRPLAGHPLIAYSVAAGLQANLVDRVICSTDSEEIADVARKYGAEIPFMRPAEIAQDDSPDIDFFNHAIITPSSSWAKPVTDPTSSFNSGPRIHFANPASSMRPCK